MEEQSRRRNDGKDRAMMRYGEEKRARETTCALRGKTGNKERRRSRTVI